MPSAAFQNVFTSFRKEHVFGTFWHVVGRLGAGPAVLGVNNNGQFAGFLIPLAASAPGVFKDPVGNAKAGAPVTIYLTGVGEVTPAEFVTFNVAKVSAALKPVLRK